MELILQPGLVERIVFEAARRDETLRPHYERQFAQCHEHRTGDQRDRAFAELHRRWFTELGLDQWIVELARGFPHVHERVGRLVVAQAPGPRAQTSELYGAPGRYTIVLTIAPSLLLDRPAFAYWAGHELLRMDDLLNPAFGHHPGERPVGHTFADQAMMTDRYAILWAISIDARLERRGVLPNTVRSIRAKELAKAFALRDSAAACSGTFDDLWQRWADSPPTHAQLMELARTGLTASREPIVEPGSTRCPPAGALCPLCRFPTFDWTYSARELKCLHADLCADFPDWSPHQPICSRCAEVYRAGARHRLKTPIPVGSSTATAGHPRSE